MTLRSADSAGGEEEARLAVEGVMAAWAKAFAGEEPGEILSLYHDEAILWGTLSPVQRDDRAALRDYFETLFGLLPGHEVVFEGGKIRVYDDFALSSGAYTFSWLQDGARRTLPSRYTFALMKVGESWMIVEHHSSAMPDPDTLTR